jgi:hypothetical protein
MRRLMTLFTLIALSSEAVPAVAANNPKALALIAAARESLGGDTALSRVHGLTATGTFQRQVGDRQIAGELTLDFEWPHNMLRTESMSPTGDATIGVNGDRLIRNSRTIGGGPGLVLRVAPVGSGPDAEAQALRSQQAEMTRLSLLWLLDAQGYAVDYTYGGEAEAADGKAEIVDVKGAGSFAVRMFMDKATHRPLMLQYRGIAPRMVMQTQRMPARPGGSEVRPDSLPQPATDPIEISLFVDDYREVDGVFLPHRITRSIGDSPNEEWTFKTITINPTFKADAFTGKNQ